MAITRQNDSSILDGDMTESLSGESNNDKLSCNTSEVIDTAVLGK